MAGRSSSLIDIGMVARKKAFHRNLVSYGCVSRTRCMTVTLFQGGAEIASHQLAGTSDYLEKEIAEATKCQELFVRIQNYEKVHPVSFKVSLLSLSTESIV